MPLLLKNLLSLLVILKFDLKKHPQGEIIQGILKDISGQSSVPNVWINGNHIGGNDSCHALDAEGKLVPLETDGHYSVIFIIQQFFKFVFESFRLCSESWTWDDALLVAASSSIAPRSGGRRLPRALQPKGPFLSYCLRKKVFVFKSKQVVGDYKAPQVARYKAPLLPDLQGVVVITMENGYR